ncbi:MAG TPA: M48 family metalloprotease [Candidatus Sulfotelmatobacter sp.]|nr:M48 family metalloprotease [Candidatus Sulfotelmatobacter sp.]
MRITQSVCLSLFLAFAYVSLSVAQDAANEPAPSANSPVANSAAPTAPQTTPTPTSATVPAATTPARDTTTTSPSAQLVPQTPATTINDVLDRVLQREHLFVAQMRHLHPMVETYIQYLKDNKSDNPVPSKDLYFLGRLSLSEGPEDTSFVGQPGFGRRMMDHLSGVYSMHFLPLGFAQMVVLDTDFQKKYYDFSFIRREFLGEIRCLVFDVQPKKGAPAGRFVGRIWVEDQDYNIVRFNGTYAPQPKFGAYLHFDSWRLNMQTGMWLPAYVYSEEADLKSGLTKGLHFKSQTRLWGYDLKGFGKSDEFTQILVDSAQSVKDRSDAASDASPLQAQRMWEKQAEDNAVDRISRVGLIAPPGDVDKVLQTVVNNLLVTNNIDLQSDIRCRILLTAPLESFTIGHTIVMSRGLLDVLPDEASLAMVLAHELSHIVLGHRIDTMMAFNDRFFFPDEQSLQRLDFKRDPNDEEAADAKALDMLKNSPYKDKLGSAGLFLKALQERAPELPNLIRPHLGNGLAAGKSLRMSSLLASAPALDQNRIDQIAALPLGGRVKVDPWSDRLELAKTKPMSLISPREKMPFEITPFFPYLTRLSPGGSDKVASTSPGGN